MFTLAILAYYLRKDARTAPGMLVAICWIIDFLAAIALATLFIGTVTTVLTWLSHSGLANDLCNMHPSDSACR